MIFFLLYSVLSIFFTFPLIFKMADHLIGWPLDGYLYIWNIDTFWHEILKFGNPFFTQKIFYPIGANLSLNSYAPLVSLLAGPFSNNRVLYLNLLIILSFAAASFTMFLFVKHLTKNKAAGFISGFFYGFSPIVSSYIISQHYYFAFAAPFIPLTLLFITKFVETQKVKYLALTAMVFWLTFFTDYYTSILVILVSVFYFLAKILVDKKLSVFLSRSLLEKSILIIVLGILTPFFILFFSLFGYPDIKSYGSQTNLYPKMCSAKLLEFVIPSEKNLILGNFSKEIRTKLNTPVNLDTPYYFIGWGSLIFAAAAILKRNNPKKILPLYTTGLLILLISLGPQTPLYGLFSKIPFVPFIDCPQRFVLGIQVFIAGLVGITAVSKKRGVLILIFAVFVIEYNFWNLPLTKISVPKIYQDLGQVEDNRTLLEIPSGLTESKGAFGYDWSPWGLNSMQMYWQTIHQKPKIGGYVSRIPSKIYEFFRSEDIVSDIFKMSSLNGKWEGEKFSEKEVGEFISKFNLGFIILSPNSRQPEFSKIVEGVFDKRISKKEAVEGFVLYTLN